ncbi:hypothetical protein A0U94_05130 [Gluconobacter albidus]|nr:hypothetical protein A0U94_05130 [Gluconobacter albidus]
MMLLQIISADADYRKVGIGNIEARRLALPVCPFSAKSQQASGDRFEGIVNIFVLGDQATRQSFRHSATRATLKTCGDIDLHLRGMTNRNAVLSQDLGECPILS